MFWLAVNSALVHLLIAVTLWVTLCCTPPVEARRNLVAGFAAAVLAWAAHAVNLVDAPVPLIPCHLFFVAAGMLIGRGLLILCGMTVPGRLIAASAIGYVALYAVSQLVVPLSHEVFVLFANTLVLPWFVAVFWRLYRQRLENSAYTIALIGMGAGAALLTMRPFLLFTLPDAVVSETSLALFALAFNLASVGVAGCTLAVQDVPTMDALTRRNVDLVEANAALQEANQHRTRFLASMSHELRTPLNAIIGFSDLGLMTADEPERHPEYFELVKQAGHRLLSVIEDLLDMARIEEGRVKLSSMEVDAAAVLKEVAALLHLELERKNVRLTLVGVDHSAPVMTDRKALERILRNLVTNAIKYNKPGGAIIAQIQAAPDQLRIVVSDTGIGMNRDELDHVFTPYYRAQRTSAGPEEGTGLGLVIVDQLVRLQGGTVDIDSTLNVGTTFQVVLPTGMLTPPAPEAEAEATRRYPRAARVHHLDGSRALRPVA